MSHSAQGKHCIYMLVRKDMDANKHGDYPLLH